MKTDTTDLLSQFDSITIKKKSILTEKDAKQMEHLQSMYEPIFKQLLEHYKAMVEYANTHPSPPEELETSTFSWSLFSEAYKIKCDYENNNYYKQYSFCPENTPAIISKKILDITVKLETDIYNFIIDEHRIKLEPEWCLIKEIFPDHWKNFKKKKTNRWNSKTEFDLQYDSEDQPTVNTEGEIPTWRTVIDKIADQMQGQTFEEIHRTQRISELKNSYLQIGLSGRTISFKSAEYSTYEKKDKTYFKLDQNPAFELLMFFENKNKIAIPKNINPKTGEFLENEGTHNVEIPLIGSDICLSMTMMRNRVLKLHFKDGTAAEKFRDWCITDNEGKKNLSKTF